MVTFPLLFPIAFVKNLMLIVLSAITVAVENNLGQGRGRFSLWPTLLVIGERIFSLIAFRVCQSTCLIYSLSVLYASEVSVDILWNVVDFCQCKPLIRQGQTSKADFGSWQALRSFLLPVETTGTSTTPNPYGKQYEKLRFPLFSSLHVLPHDRKPSE